MADTSAQSKVADYVTSNYGTTPALTGAGPTGVAAPAGVDGASRPATSVSGTTGGMLAAAAAPAAPAAATAAPKVDINSWYRSTLGRDGDTAGVSYWQKALDGGADAQKLFSDFEAAAAKNNENVNTGTTWAQANNYTGPMSSDKTSVVDDWGRNVLGRNLTPQEQATWSSQINAAGTAENANKVYQNFLNTMGAQVRSPMDFASASKINSSTPVSSSPYAPHMIDKNDLTLRTIDKPTETVQGQLKSILAEDSPVLQQARNDAMRAAADRGMLNSAMAASGGEDAVIRSATGIATTDSGYYNHASDYNAAAQNQLLQLNQQAQNAALLQAQQLDASAAQQDKTLQSQTSLQSQSLQSQKDLQTTQLSSQMTIAQMQDATTRLGQTKGSEDQKLSLANNIIANMDMSPDRKAAMLESLGMGTSARPGVPGTGLAGAVYVIDSTSADLNMADPSNVFGEAARAAVGQPSDETKALWAQGKTTSAPPSNNPNAPGTSWGPDAPGYG